MDESVFEALAAGMLIISIIGLILIITTAYLLWNTLSKIPESHRKIEPYFAWLTLIPFVGIAIFWMLLPFKLPESLQSFFRTKADSDMDTDFGKLLGIMTATSYTLLFIPFINYIALFTAPTFLILYLVQVRKIAKQLPSNKGKSNKTLINNASVKANKTTQAIKEVVTTKIFKKYMFVFLITLGTILFIINYNSHYLDISAYVAFVYAVLLPFYYLLASKPSFFRDYKNILYFVFFDTIFFIIVKSIVSEI